MATTPSQDGYPAFLLQDRLRAVAQYGERLGDLVAAFLDATGLFPTNPAPHPAAYLLELAAVLELGRWELQGLRTHLEVSLPSYHDAAKDLAARCARGPAAFQGQDTPQLSNQVLRVWLSHFAWEAPEFLGADVVIGGVDEDQFIDLLAEFAWNHHREVQHTIGNDMEK